MLSKFIDHFGCNVAQQCTICCSGTSRQFNETNVINRSERWKSAYESERLRMRFLMHCMHAPNKFHFVNNNQLKSIDQLIHFIVIRRLLDNFREKGTDEVLFANLEIIFVIRLLSLLLFQYASSIFAHVKHLCEWKSSFVSKILS